MQTEIKLLELDLSVQILEKQKKLSQDRMEEMNALIVNILKSKSVNESKNIILERKSLDANMDLYYDTCTDVSDSESVANLSDLDSPERKTPIRNMSLEFNPPSTLKRKKKDIDVTKKKKPLEPIQSCTLDPMKTKPNTRRRMSMIPQLTARKK